MNEGIILLPFWFFAPIILGYGIYGLKRGKIRAFTRNRLFKDLTGKPAFVYSLILLTLGGLLLAGLIYNASRCGILSVCE